MPEPLDLSVAIMCKDNEDTIRQTLDSVRSLASEVVAVDSGSTDRTMDILREHGARVVERPWQGYIETCQIAMELCTKTWVLAIDTDESVGASLAHSIRDSIAKADDAVAGFRMNRKVWYRGKYLEHAWQPEWRLRIVRRSLMPEQIRSMGAEPHHRIDWVRPNPAMRIVDLRGDLRHDTIRDLASFLRGQVRLADQGAASLASQGAKPSASRVITSPIGAFLKQIVLKQAWRDGWRGWVAAGSAALATLAKHVLLFDHAHREPAEPGNESQAPTESSTLSEYDAPSHSSPTTSTPDPRQDLPQQDGAVMSDSPAEERGPAEDQQNEPLAKDGSADDSPTKKKRRRRRRRRGPAEGDGAPAPAQDASDTEDSSAEDRENREDREPQRPKKTKPKPPPVASDPEVFAIDKTFADLGLDEEILAALDDAGFKHPTHIQHQLIPPALTGGDILGQAKTGTGKTAAFGLPVLQMAKKGEPFQALILSPTRELAIQIRDGLRDLAAKTGLRLCAVYGGQRMHTQIQELEQGPEIIVGTPGRVMDMVGRGHLRFDKIRFAVLDEVDRMLDIGFREDIRKILRMCPKERQTIMVSATLSPEIEDLARRYMDRPDKIVTTSGSLTVKLVEQHYLTVEPWDKKKLLRHLLTHEEPALTLVFCRLKRTVDDLDRYLRKHGIESHAIHGDLRQSKREQVIKQLRKGSLEVLIASDLAARGLDVVGISHVINYDLPEDPDLYVHRIGRTARAGRGGIAWSFVTPAQGKLLTHIELLINAQIDRMEYPDFDYTERPEGWKDDTPTRPIAKVDAPPPVNRMAGPAIPTGQPKDAKSQKKLDEKFPGGIVPTKLPAKRMHGKLSTGRGKR